MQNFEVMLVVTLAMVAAVRSDIDEECKTIPMMSIESCCATPDFLNDELIDACYETGLNDPGGEPNITCVLECFFRDAALIKDDKFDTEAIKMYVHSKATGRWRESIDKMVSTCVDKISSALGGIKGSDLTKETGCRTTGHRFFICSYSYFANECVQKYWPNGEKCADQKKFIEKCLKL